MLVLLQVLEVKIKKKLIKLIILILKAYSPELRLTLNKSSE